MTEVKSIRNQLNTLKTPPSNHDLVVGVINVLPSTYNSFISHLSNDFATMDFNTLEGLLLKEEGIMNHQEATSSSNIAPTFTARNRGRNQSQQQPLTQKFSSMNLNQPPQQTRNQQKRQNVTRLYYGKPGNVILDYRKRQSDL